MELTTEAKALIDTIIEKQEGGWKLTSNANDPDGGWTYAGVTAKEFAAYQGIELSQVAVAEVHHLLETEVDVLNSRVYEIYYTRYYQPLQLDKLPAAIRGPLFSAAVNCGTKTAVMLLQTTWNIFWNKCHSLPELVVDGVFGSKTLSALVMDHSYTNNDIFKNVFLREWTRHYINLVQKNAEAWVKVANDFDDITSDGAVNASDILLNKTRDKMPKVNRASQLEGWFNRVEFWR